MFALNSRFLRRRLSAPTSGSARRRARERRRAEQTRAEGERLARERRERRLLDKREQQLQAREELASYDPWGRAGGGAPNLGGPRRADLRGRGIYPEEELKGLSVHEPFRWWSPRRPRRRSRSSRRGSRAKHAEAPLPADEDNGSRQPPVADSHQSYKKALDNIINTKNKIIRQEMRQDLGHARKMQGLDAVWGRPGPGGAVWRNPRDIGLNFSKSMGWTDNEIFGQLKGELRRSKRSSLTLPKVKRDEDSPGVQNGLGDKPSSVEKLPDISANGGSPGSGSRGNGGSGGEKPERNSKTRSPKKKFVKRLSNGVVSKIVTDEDYVANGEGENKNVSNGCNGMQCTPEAAILRITGGVELVPLLARSRPVGARTLHSSDVTRPPEQACQWREILNEDYLRELKNQMRVKYKHEEESRKNSAESCLKHYETWTSLWGRPGHGAPQLRGKYSRSDLARLLYVPPAL